MENVRIEGIAYYDGQFKTGIPEGLMLTHFSLFIIKKIKDHFFSYILSTFDFGLLQMLLTINLFLQCLKHKSIPTSIRYNLLHEKKMVNKNSKNILLASQLHWTASTKQYQVTKR